MKHTALCLFITIFAGTALAAPQSVFSLKTDIAGWTAPHATSNQPSNALTDLGMENLSVQVFVDGTNLFTVARINTTTPDARTAWLRQTNHIALEAVSADTYQWRLPAPKPGYPDLSSQNNIRFRFSGGSVLMADTNHFGYAEQLAPVGTNGLLVCSVNVTPLIDPLFAALAKFIDAQEEGFLKAILGGAIDGLKKSAQAVKEFPRITVTIDPTSDQTRRMDLALEFNLPAAALLTQAFYGNAGNAWKNPVISDTQLSLISLAASPDFKSLERNGNTLHFRYEWPADRDQEMLKTLTSPLTGNLFSLASGRNKEYPSNTEVTIPDPALHSVSQLDAAKLENEIRAATFFDGQSHNQIRLTIDYLDVPNKELMNTSFTNIILTGTNGVELALAKRPAQYSTNSDEQTGHIYLKTEKGSPEAETASFTFQVEVPVEIEKHTLSPDAPLYETEQGGCCLLAISNSVVRIRAKDFSLRDAKIYARNRNGDYLGRSSATWTATRFTGTFKGLPATVEVVLPTHYETLSIDYRDLPVTKDAEPRMPNDPTNNIPTRYTQATIPVFSDPDMDTFAHESMTIETNAGYRKNQCILHFPKPANAKPENLALKSYLAGTDAFVFTGRKNGYGYDSKSFNWSSPQQAMPTDATAVFGTLTASFWTGTGSYSADIATNPVPLIEGRDAPTVHADSNVVWIQEAKDEDILDVQAYDASGRRLKRNYRTAYRNGERGYFFWGQPVRTTVAYATGTVTSTVPFQAELKDGGLTAVPEAKARAAAFETFLDEVRQINKDSNRISSLLAANYYVINGNNEPTADVPLEIAQSDPDGATIFGYEAKPYKGYYFRRIKQAGNTSPHTSTYGWTGGSFDAGGQGFLLATPVETKRPAILIRWGDIFVNYNDCSQLEEIDTDTNKMKENGWLQIR